MRLLWQILTYHRKQTVRIIVLSGFVALMLIGLYASIAYLTNRQLQYGSAVSTAARKDIRVLTDQNAQKAYWNWYWFLRKIIAAAFVTVSLTSILVAIVLALPSAPPSS